MPVRPAITIALPRKRRKALDEHCRREGDFRSDLGRESLRDYLFIRRFRSVRRRRLRQSRRRGVYADDDVFRRVS